MALFVRLFIGTLLFHSFLAPGLRQQLSDDLLIMAHSNQTGVRRQLSDELLIMVHSDQTGSLDEKLSRQAVTGCAAAWGPNAIALGFGDKIGRIPFQLLAGRPGEDVVLHCEDFGAPAGATGSCTFTCSSSGAWKMLSWDTCTCEFPWGADITVTAGDSVEILMECTKPCNGGKFEVLDPRSQVVGSTDFEDGKRWLHSVSIETLVLATGGDIDGQVTFKWEPRETSTGKTAKVLHTYNVRDLLKSLA